MIYKDLVVWQKAINLVKVIYSITRTFPQEERFGLASQLNRAAVSVPSNIAEGNGRETTRDYLHFLHQARGSLYEVQTQLVIAEELGFSSNVSMAIALSDEVARMLNSVIQKLKLSADNHEQLTTSH